MISFQGDQLRKEPANTDLWQVETGMAKVLFHDRCQINSYVHEDRLMLQWAVISTSRSVLVVTKLMFSCGEHL